MSLPDEAQVSRALKHLADTDVEEAVLRGAVKAIAERRKITKAIAYQNAEGTNADRQEAAYASPAYKDLIDEMENTIADHALIENKRQRAILTIDVWRSINANQRKGNI